MKHILKRAAALLLALSLMTIPAFAQEGGVQESDPFVFLCPSAGVDDDGDQIPSRWYKNGAEGRTWVSKHTIGYNFIRLDGTFLDEGNTMKVTTGLFHLDRTDVEGESYAAYCCDFVNSAYGNALYRRMNLEDASYFTDEEAAHIRGIFEHGYWLNWDEDPEVYLAKEQVAANQWLENKWLQENPTIGEEPRSDSPDAGETAGDGSAEGSGEGTASEKPEITDLTVDQVMTATQLAIWNFANSEEGWYTYEYFPSPIELNEHNTPQANNNIMLFRDYLVHQTAAYADPEDILFSDGQFISASAVLSAGGDVDYSITLRFKLAGPVEQADDLTVTATLGEHSAAQKLTAESADANGYYTMTLSGISREEADTAQYKIALELTGSQEANGVYFYEAKDPDGEGSRDASQNLVGKAVGSTPVTARCEIPFALGERSVSLYKYDAGNKVSAEAEGAVVVGGEYYKPLSGAVFDLYAKVDGVNVLLKSGLTCDSKGHLVVMGLADGYEYFFKETTPPAGYDPNNGEFPAQPWDPAVEGSETPAYVPNTETVIYIPPTTHLTVKKVWVGDEEENRPEEILVQLMRNDKPYGAARVLSEKNNWKYTWWGLDDWFRWSAEELSVPESYSAEAEKVGRTVTITNTYQPPEIPEEPEVPEEPEIPEEPEESENLDEVLADVPKTGDQIGLWSLFVVVGGVGLIGLILMTLKRKKT